MSAKVTQNKKGHFVMVLSGTQYLELIDFIDFAPEYQKNSQMTPLQRVWMIVLQKMKDRFSEPRILEDKMKVIFRLEEAIILTQMYFRMHLQEHNILDAEMMELDRLLQ